MPSAEHWESLILAALAVGGFSIDSVLEIEPDLRSAGLLSPVNLARWGPEKVTRELYAAGYRRGMLTGMYAERLVAIGKFADDSMRDSDPTLGSGDHEAIRHLLLPIFGVGPKVIENFFALMQRDGLPPAG